MIRELAKSVREYKKASIMTPIWVALEVVLECIIPFIMAMLVNQIKAGCTMTVIFQYGVVLVVMALLSLFFGYDVRLQLRGSVLRTGEEPPQRYVLQRTEVFV